tara:strand:+ start:6589 stop:6756 length:168 start_codon:yes stop_codon:yes gene_type:complete
MRLAQNISLGSNKPGGGRSTALIVDAFRRRVVSRGGSTSRLSCLTSQLNAIKNIA